MNHTSHKKSMTLRGRPISFFITINVGIPGILYSILYVHEHDSQIVSAHNDSYIKCGSSPRHQIPPPPPPPPELCLNLSITIKLNNLFVISMV